MGYDFGCRQKGYWSGLPTGVATAVHQNIKDEPKNPNEKIKSCKIILDTDI